MSELANLAVLPQAAHCAARRSLLAEGINAVLRSFEAEPTPRQ